MAGVREIQALGLGQAPGQPLDLPALVMSGLQDRVFFDAADVERLAGRLPKAQRLDFADAGHLIPVERPEATIQALLDFAAWVESA